MAKQLTKPNWNKLKSNRCPKCGEFLNLPFPDSPKLECSNCEFKINIERFKEIVNKLVEKQLKQQYGFKEKEYEDLKDEDLTEEDEDLFS